MDCRKAVFFCAYFAQDFGKGGVAMSKGGVAMSKGGVAMSKGGVAMSKGSLFLCLFCTVF